MDFILSAEKIMLIVWSVLSRVMYKLT